MRMTKRGASELTCAGSHASKDAPVPSSASVSRTRRTGACLDNGRSREEPPQCCCPQCLPPQRCNTPSGEGSVDRKRTRRDPEHAVIRSAIQALQNAPAEEDVRVGRRTVQPDEARVPAGSEDSNPSFTSMLDIGISMYDLMSARGKKQITHPAAGHARGFNPSSKTVTNSSQAKTGATRKTGSTPGAQACF